MMNDECSVSTRGSRRRAGPFIILHLPLCIVSLLVVSAPAGAEAPVPPHVEAAIDRGLKWLGDHQVSKDAAGPLPAGATWATGGLGRSTAVTSLAVMAFLARGHTPGQGPYGEVVNQAIDFVLASQ